MIKLVFVFIFLLLIPIIHTAFSDSILGAGTSIRFNDKNATGTITLNGIQYKIITLQVKKETNVSVTGSVIHNNIKSKLILFGIPINSSQYNFKGMILSPTQMISVKTVLNIAQDSKIVTQKSKMVTQNSKPTQTIKPPPQKMIILLRTSDRLYVEYSYAFSVKVFDPKKITDSGFDTFYGTIPNVNFIVTIHKGSDVLHQFKGSTDNYGLYSDSWRLTFTPDQIQYDVDFNATKTGFQDKSIQEKVFIMQPSQGRFNSTGS
jgi:hypothetical protein